MFGLGKKKKTKKSADSQTTQAVEEVIDSPHAQKWTKQEDLYPVSTGYGDFSRDKGPWDESEISADEDYLDFGSLRVKMRDGLNVRLEIEQKNKQLVAVTLMQGQSSLQVQAFAAPKRAGIWDELRREIASSVREQEGSVELRDGRLGREMISKLPAHTKDGRKGFRVARFVGVDGPRWFLRGVFSGDAALKPEAAAQMEEIFCSIVVVRGEEPKAPRDLLPMRAPGAIGEHLAQTQNQTQTQGQNQKQAANAGQSSGPQQHNSQPQQRQEKLEMPRRGPEITEIR